MLRTVNVSETLNEELERHARYSNLSPEDVINAALADYLRPRHTRRRRTEPTSANGENQAVEEETPEAQLARVNASVGRIARMFPDLPSLPENTSRTENFYEERY